MSQQEVFQQLMKQKRRELTQKFHALENTYQKSEQRHQKLIEENNYAATRVLQYKSLKSHHITVMQRLALISTGDQQSDERLHQYEEINVKPVDRELEKSEAIWQHADQALRTFEKELVQIEDARNQIIQAIKSLSE